DDVPPRGWPRLGGARPRPLARCAHDDLAARGPRFEEAVRLDDLLEGEDVRRPGAKPAGFRARDQLGERNVRERQLRAPEEEGAREEAELDAARQIAERV